MPSRFTLCFVGAVVASLGMARAQSLEQFEAWVRETAVPIEALDEPMSPALRRVWSELRGERSFVLLGEPDHSIVERYETRLWLMPVLYDAGFRHIVSESGVESGRRFDAVLAGGEDLMSRACMTALLGEDEGVERWTAPPIIPAREKALRTFRSALKAMGGDDRWHVHGFDVELAPACAYKRALDVIDAHAGQAADLRRVHDELYPRAAESPAQERVRLDFAFALFRSASRRLERSLGSEAVNNIRETLAQLDASVTLTRMLSKSSSLHEEWRVFAKREKMMVSNVERIITEGGDDMRAVFLAHNVHFAFDSSQIAYGPISPSATLLWKTLGTALHERYGEELLGVWLMVQRGTRLELEGSKGAVQFELPPDAIESVFARVGGPFVLALDSDDPRATWLDEVRHFGVNGKLAHGRLRELTDVVIFVPEAHAINELNAAGLER